MLNFRKLFTTILVLSFGAMFMNEASAYEHEVWQSGGQYYWKTFDVQRGSSSDLAVAIEGAMESGNRDIHVITSGTLYSTINVSAAGVRLYCHSNTFTCSFTGSGILNNGNDGFEIHDLTLRNVVGGYGIRSSAASNLSFINVSTIDIGWIGMRIDSRTSDPWSYTIYNLYMRDCHFENCGTHGLETYSIDGLTLEGTMTARNCGECGVLFNQSRNGTVATVDAYDCCWGGGYAGLRYANACENITTEKLIADHCGRGFFIVQSGPSVNCHLNNAEIYECSGLGIWIENGTNCSVKAGCCESSVSVSGSGSYANVSSSCSGEDEYYHMQSRLSSKCISIQDGSTSDNANIEQADCNSTYWRQQWMLNDLGNGYFQIKSRHSGKCMRASGSNVVQYTCYDSYWTEMFTREDAGDGYFIYRNRHANQCLRVENSSTSSGASIVLDNCNTSYYSQQFERVTLKSATGSEALVANVEIYPSVVNDILNIQVQEELNGEALLRLFNVNGAMIFSKVIENGKNTIDLSGIPSGIYFAQLTYNKKHESQKIIKK